jgi:propanol-preferring alcohol dehydrogenase
MFAMRLHTPGAAAAGPLRGEELEELEATPGQIVVRVGACAVCRTDLQLCEGDLALRKRPVVPGHQVVGVVTAIGDGVAGWKLGQRAGIAWLGGACGVCARCREGRENLCVKATFTGWDHDGGYATHVRARADFALPLPSDDRSDASIAPLLCGGIIGYRALKIAGARPGCRLGLYGFGASAFLAIQIARHWGCEIFVCTRSEAERARALRMGAVWAGDYADVPPSPLDCAVTFAPSGDVVLQALRAVDRGGTVAINAIHLDRVPPLDYHADLWWERSLRSVANFTRDDARELLALATRIPLETHYQTMPLADANRALAALSAGRVDGALVLLAPSPS